jgi:hypothetical protein
MKRAAIPAALLGVSLLAVAAEVRIYPGATAEDFEAWRRKHPNVTVPAGMHVKRYTTPDPLDKVVAFGQDRQRVRRAVRLQTGEEIHMRTFILDAKEDVQTSKLFVKFNGRTSSTFRRRCAARA